MKIDLSLLKKEETGKKTLTIAIGKGRGFEESLHFLETTLSDDFMTFAKGGIPVYSDKKNNVKLVKVRNKDLPWLLAKGHIDVAIGSSIWFDEYSFSSLKMITELPLLKCRLSVIGTHQLPVTGITTICSKFVSLTNQFIQQNKLDAKLIVMEGCHEVALSLGMSDAIIDIIETGRTIMQMDFVELKRIREVTHGLWTREKDASQIENILVYKKELRYS
jgi:ATP phosphoribosyltransferase